MKNRIALTNFDRCVILELWQCRCAYCDATLAQDDGMHIDHVLAWTAGGMHALSNLAPACASCNLTKGSATHVAAAGVAAMAFDLACRVADGLDCTSDEVIVGVERGVLLLSTLIRRNRIVVGPTKAGL